MDIYLVGGAVRDKLLGLPAHERDWVVVGATPEEMLDLGYTPVGKDFPVFLHPETKEEYALARTERKTAPGYKGFAFNTDREVTLVEDLKRRDLTINAMAEGPTGELIDPYGGQSDLDKGRLRHVSPAFSEDPVRVLRVARLAARFGKWGFSVAHGTNTLMREMVANGEVDHLVPERVWAELAKAMATDTPEKFFTVLHGCHALGVLFPEIEHDYDKPMEAHTRAGLPKHLQMLKQCAEHSSDSRIRFAALLLSTGEQLSTNERLDQATSICERYRVPNDYAQLATIAIRSAETISSKSAAEILSVMEAAGAFRGPTRWQQLLHLFQATGHIDTSNADLLENARQRAANISAASVEDKTLQGPELGEAIRTKRREAIEQTLKT
ncbi:multifunctional CCA tRNA nucleotidyl transferase/2'3'-cyclic phosphodiesterase/2'nucleotidase/phosphatase [Pseudomonadota bacterium]